jgi:hypothetical protein
MVGKITGLELLQDVPAAMEIVTESQARISRLPADAKASGLGAALGFGGVALAACETFDRVKSGPVTIDVVAEILGLEPDGPAAKLVALIKVVQAQAAS